MNKWIASLVAASCVLNIGSAVLPEACANAAVRRRTVVRKRFIKPQKSNRVDFTLTYNLSITGRASSIKMMAAIPKTMPYRQRIHKIKFSPEPTRLFSEGDRDYAEFVFTNPSDSFKIEMNVRATLLKYDLSTAMKKKSNYDQNSDFSEFLKHEKYIEKDNPKIMEIANSIEGQRKGDIVKNIFAYVIDNMVYIVDNMEGGALYAVEQRKGDCDEYADLFVALCRARNIPARRITGYSSITPKYTSNPRHAWAEVYLSSYGWVPFDPSYVDGNDSDTIPYDTLGPVYVYITHKRHDKTMSGHGTCVVEDGGKVQLRTTIEFRKVESIERKEKIEERNQKRKRRRY